MLYSEVNTFTTDKEKPVSYKIMFVLNAFVALVLGAIFLVIPMSTLTFFGAEQYVVAKILAQFFGAAMVALGLLLWFAKDVEEEKILKGMGYAMFASSLIGLILTVIGVSPASGVIRNYGWLSIIVYVLFALGYAYLLFTKPRSE